MLAFPRDIPNFNQSPSEKNTQEQFPYERAQFENDCPIYSRRKRLLFFYEIVSCSQRTPGPFHCYDNLIVSINYTFWSSALGQSVLACSRKGVLRVGISIKSIVKLKCGKVCVVYLCRFQHSVFSSLSYLKLSKSGNSC